MSSVAILIWVIILGLVGWLVVQLISRVSGSYRQKNVEMAIAYSKLDFVRQVLGSVALIATGIWLGVVTLWLNLDIDWYWIWIVIGCSGILLGFWRNAPIVFIGGIVQLGIGSVQAGIEIASKGYPYVIVVLSVVGLLAGMKSASSWLEEYPRAQRYALILEVFSIAGLLAITLAYGSLSSKWLWAELRSEENLTIYASLGAIVLLLFTSKDIVLGFILKAWKAKVGILDLPITLLWMVVYALIWSMPNVTNDYIDFGSSGVLATEILVPVIVLNAVFLTTIGWLLYEGVQRKQIWKLNVSILALFIFVIQRYFDWFQNSFLDRSIFFIVLGTIFLAAGFVLERLRSKLIEEVTQPDHVSE